MNKYTKVQGHTHLVRDNKTGAVLNTDSVGATQARHRKKAWKDQQEELAQLRSDVATMKQMLQQLLEDKHGDNDS